MSEYIKNFLFLSRLSLIKNKMQRTISIKIA